MNIMTIIVLLLFGLFTALGFKRGLFKSVFKLVIMAAALLVSYLITPFVSNLIINHTELDTYINDKTYAAIYRVAENRVKEELGNAASGVVDELTEIALNVEPSRSQQVDIIQRMNLPEFMTNAIITNNNDEVRGQLGADNFYKYLAFYISYMIVNAISFVLSFALVFIIANIIYFAAGIVRKLPVVGGIDRIGGAALGFCEALLVVWLVFVLLSVFSNTEIGEGMVRQIENSSLLGFIYDKNVFSSLITKLFKG